MVHRLTLPRAAFVVTTALLAAASSGCGPSYVRGGQVEGLDDTAMGTGLDRRDIQQLLHDNLKALMSSPVALPWSHDGSHPTIAIYPLANETSEHIDSQLNALLSDVETYLVNSGPVTVVSVE